LNEKTNEENADESEGQQSTGVPANNTTTNEYGGANNDANDATINASSNNGENTNDVVTNTNEITVVLPPDLAEWIP
jgi:hypothetical protein